MNDEKIYSLKWWNVILVGFVTWLSVILMIIYNIYTYNVFDFGLFMFLNVLLGSLTIALVYLFFNYLKFSLKKEVILSNNSIKEINQKNGETTIINFNELFMIQIHKGTGYNSPVIWGDKLFISGADNTSREVYCFSRVNGKLLWTGIQTISTACCFSSIPRSMPSVTPTRKKFCCGYFVSIR